MKGFCREAVSLCFFAKTSFSTFPSMAMITVAEIGKSV